MKSVLISIQPKWCELIAIGKKTIEVRKTRPKIETPFKCYIYCTLDGGIKGDIILKDGHASKAVCGMVIGEFVCDEIKTYPADDFVGAEDSDGTIIAEPKDGVFAYWIPEEKETCLPYEEIIAYGNGKTLYGWHISDLKIYDKPKDLSEFSYWLGFISDGATDNHGHLKRPPQSWCYVEEKIENQEVSLDYWLGADLDESIDMS